MNKHKFENTPLSEISSYTAWEQIEILLPERQEVTYFQGNGVMLLTYVVMWYLRAIGHDVQHSPNPYARFGHSSKIELQADINGIFVLINLRMPWTKIPDVRTHFEASAIEANGQVWYINSIDDLLSHLKTIGS